MSLKRNWNGGVETGYPRRKTILEFEQAKKTMEVKMEAEKFRVGSKVRLLERKVLKFQMWIAFISVVCIALAILAQEITFYGTYSNRFGGQWFDPVVYVVCELFVLYPYPRRRVPAFSESH